MDQRDTIRKEVLGALKEGEQDGSIREMEYRMIRNVFSFMDQDAKDVMTHRKNIVALNCDDTLEEAAAFASKAKNSRFPVYEEEIDNILGIVHIRDIMKFYLDPDMRGKKLKEIGDALMPVGFIPETRKISRLFMQMKANQSHLCVVIDEYGQTSGLVAMEDIIEEIMGNIRDEYDEEEEMIRKSEEGSYLVDGLCGLTELSDVLGIVFQDEDEDNEYETLNGFLIVKLERIPAEKEECSVFYEGYLFEIQQVIHNIIRKVKITKTELATETKE